MAECLAWAVLAGLLVAIAWTDIREQRIPNVLNGALAVSGFGAAAMPSGPGLVDAAGGGLLGGACLLAIAVAYRRVRGVDGLGLGDVKFLVGAGAWTGWQGVGPTVFIAAVAALCWLALRSLAGVRHAHDTPLAFGPFLCFALFFVCVTQHASQ